MEWNKVGMANDWCGVDMQWLGEGYHLFCHLWRCKLFLWLVWFLSHKNGLVVNCDVLWLSCPFGRNDHDTRKCVRLL